MDVDYIDSFKGPVEVGQYLPNPWEFFDMYGNVSEVMFYFRYKWGGTSIHNFENTKDLSYTVNGGNMDSTKFGLLHYSTYHNFFFSDGGQRRGGDVVFELYYKNYLSNLDNLTTPVSLPHHHSFSPSLLPSAFQQAILHRSIPRL